ETVERLARHAARSTCDSAFGLHMAEVAVAEPRHNLPASLYYALRNSPTLEEAGRRFIRYSSLVHELVELRLDASENPMRFSYRMSRGLPRSCITAERILGTACLWARLHVGADIAPRQVRFSHPRPESISEHQRIFLTEPRFEQDVDELTVDAVDFARPIE